MTSPAELADRLGGRRALGLTSTYAADWHALVAAGVPFAAVDALKNLLKIADAEMATLLGISHKTLSRLRASSQKLDTVASDRLYRTARIVSLAIDVLEAEEPAIAWLKRPQIGLGGKRPLALLTTDAGTTEVKRLLIRMEHGVYS